MGVGIGNVFPSTQGMSCVRDDIYNLISFHLSSTQDLTKEYIINLK